MVANSIGLTNLNITQAKGQAAFLPNQPILQGCVVNTAAATELVPGDIVKLVAGAGNIVIVDKADVTDLPFGVVVYQGIKSGFKAGERVSVFPANSFVYLPAGNASITRGAKLQFNAQGQVVATTEAGNGYIGTALTEPGVTGDLIVVQIQPSI